MCPQESPDLNIRPDKEEGEPESFQGGNVPRDPTPEAPPEKPTRKERRLKEEMDQPNEQDQETAEAFKRIQAWNGAASKVVIKRRHPSGKYLYCSGENVFYNPAEEEPETINQRIADLYGPGDYLVTVVPPRESKVPPVTYPLSIAPQREDRQVPTGQPPVANTATVQQDRPPFENTSPLAVVEAMAKTAQLLNAPQLQQNEVLRDLGAQLQDAIEEMRERTARPAMDVPPSFSRRDPGMRAMEARLDRIEVALDNLLHAKGGGGSTDNSFTNLASVVKELVTPFATMFAGMAAQNAAKSQGEALTPKGVLDIIAAANAMKQTSTNPRDVNTALVEMLLDKNKSERDPLETFVQGINVGKTGQISVEALELLRRSDEEQPAGLGAGILGIAEKAAEAFGANLGLKVGEAGADLLKKPTSPVTGQAAPRPVSPFPGQHASPKPWPIRDQQPTGKPTAPMPGTSPGAAPGAAPGGPRPAAPAPAGERPPTGGPNPPQGERRRGVLVGAWRPPQPQPGMVPLQVSGMFLATLASPATPEAIAAQVVERLPQGAKEHFKLPFEEGLAKLKPVLDQGHFETLLQLRPKADQTFEAIQKILFGQGELSN